MGSLILRTIARPMLPVLMLFSIFLLLRGHNLPGGGFAGGLVAAAAIVLQLLAHDAAAARRILIAEPLMLLATGLGVALLSGLASLAWGLPLMTGRFLVLHLPGGDEFVLGSPTIFDLGVYLVVLGVVLLIVLNLAEE